MSAFSEDQKRGFYCVIQLSADAANVVARALFDDDRAAPIEVADLLVDALDTLLREAAIDHPSFVGLRKACAEYIKEGRAL